jgi:hypothetical protein
VPAPSRRRGFDATARPAAAGVDGRRDGPHRFVDFSADSATRVVFHGPTGGEPG